MAARLTTYQSGKYSQGEKEEKGASHLIGLPPAEAPPISGAPSRYNRSASLALSRKTVFDNLPSPPVAEKKPVSDTRHGITRTDDYAWMRAENWQAMFKDPSLLDAQLRRHLEAENAYMEAAMADTKELQKQLFAEMKGRIKEDDSSIPMKDGPFADGTACATGG